jgi:hypothetical protein
MDKRPRRNMRLMSANSRDMREFIGIKRETKPETKKRYYEIRAKIVVHKGHIDVTAITDLERNLPIFPVRIYVVSHNHSSYVHDRVWHLYDGVYKIARITRDRTHVKIIEVRNGEARTVKEYTTD